MLQKYIQKFQVKAQRNFSIPILVMPQISYFLGVIIRMFYRDHNPPQFHAFYGDYQALIDIQKNEILSGTLPPRVLGIVV